MSDEELGPPPEGWEAFYDANIDALLRAASRVLGRTATQGDGAEDIVAEVLRRLIAKGVSTGQSARAYALTSVRNLAVDRARRQKHVADMPSEEDGPVSADEMESAVEDEILLADVLDALNQLPDKERMAIQGKFLDGRPWREVAADVGVTTSAGLMKIVNRGLDRIRKLPRFAGLADAPRPASPSAPTGRPQT